MKMIKWLMKEIKEEVCGAATYAERYIQYQTEKPSWSRMYSDMASQELTHAEYLKTMAQEYIDGLSYVPESDKEKWQRCIENYAEKTAWVKLMLAK